MGRTLQATSELAALFGHHIQVGGEGFVLGLDGRCEVSEQTAETLCRQQGWVALPEAEEGADEGRDARKRRKP